MSERDEALAALRNQAGGIDPAIDQAINYARGVRAVQEVTRQQGQVMSQALANNHLLYHTNKKLTQRARELEADLAEVRRLRAIDADAYARDRAAWEEHREMLIQSGGDRFRALYESSIRTMTAWLYAELTPAQLKERLDELKAQAGEIDRLPDRVTPEELAEAGAAQPVFGKHQG